MKFKSLCFYGVYESVGENLDIFQFDGDKSISGDAEDKDNDFTLKFKVFYNIYY